MKTKRQMFKEEKPFIKKFKRSKRRKDSEIRRLFFHAFFA